MKRALQRHQAARLRNTYQDLIDSEYQQLGEFFFTEIYGEQDFSRRNEAFKKLHYFLKDAMGERIFSGIERLIQLNDLTEKLDELLIDQLLAADVSIDFTNKEYETAYRNADNYAERVHQIELMTTSTAFMHGMSQLKTIGWVIKGVRLAAVFIGVSDVMRFLDLGYQAFRSAPNIEKFNSTIYQREMDRLNRIYQKT